jgi:hypothetical protein
MRASGLVYPYRAMGGYAIEQGKQIVVAQAYTAMGQRSAHRFSVGRAMQIDVTLEGIDRTQPVVPARSR